MQLLYEFGADDAHFADWEVVDRRKNKTGKLPFTAIKTLEGDVLIFLNGTYHAVVWDN